MVQWCLNAGPPLSEPFQAAIYHCNLHSLQAANCCRNSRLVVDEDDLMWFKIEEIVFVEQFQRSLPSKTLSCEKSSMFSMM